MNSNKTIIFIQKSGEFFELTTLLNGTPTPFFFPFKKGVGGSKCLLIPTTIAHHLSVLII